MDNSDGSATPGECAIVVSATFTAEGIQPGLAFWVRELGLDFPLRFAGYNQLFTQLLDPVGLFARNRGFNVALVRMEDWLSAGMRDSAVSVVDAIRSAAASFPAQLIVAICPSTPEHAADSAEPERALQDGVADLAGVLVITPAELQTLYPVREPHASYGSVVGHLPYTPEYFAALATLVVRKIHAISAPPFKVIALDCDETLWAGICGEDGPHGVVIDAPRQKLQEYMVEKRRQGMLLALVSKNNEADVVQTFRAHPEMLLSLADFSALRIN